MWAKLAGSLLAVAALAAPVVGAPVTAEAGTTQPCTADWSRVRSPSPGTIYSVLLDVAAVGSGHAWAVGFRAYFDANDEYAVSPIIERWNGSSWTVARQPDAQGQLAGVFALSSDDVWAVGHTGLESPEYRPLIMHWDGTNWRRVSSPRVPMAYLTAIGGSGPDDLWAAGTLIGTYETIIEHWDGTRWTVVPHPSPSSSYVALGGVAADGPDDVSIVGTFQDGQARNVPLGLHWNGEAWRRTRPIKVGEFGTSLSDVTVSPSSRVWAVGSYQSGRNGRTQTLVQRWTGRGWTLALTPRLRGSSSLASVTSGPDGAWAVGSQDRPKQRPKTLIERWRPRSGQWQVAPSPNARGDNYLLGVDQSATGELWAVGFHRNGPELTLTEHRCG